jgi:hypothetical protein
VPHLPPMLPDPESRLAYYLDMAFLAEEFACTADDAGNREDWAGLAKCWRSVADSYADLLYLRKIALPGQTPFPLWGGCSAGA